MNTAREFTKRLVGLLRNERNAMAEFLVALAEFDGRKLYRELGHASLFSFLTIELKLSAGAAQYRKTAAELVQRFPEVETALRDGRLCFSAVIQVAKVLTPENCADVLPRFFGLSARDAAFVAVSIRPVDKPPQRTVLTLLRPAVKPAATADVGAIEAAAPLLAFRTSEVPPQAVPPERTAAAVIVPPPVNAPSPAPALVPLPPRRSTVEPLDADHGRMHLTVSRRFLQKLQDAKNAESHAHPGATDEEILELALDALLAQRAKRKGIGVQPRNTPRPAKLDTITAEMTRALYERSGGRCEWIFESGERCNSAVRPERDHIDARGRGGPTTLANTRILCKPHNDLSARRTYGDRWMDRFTGNRRKPGDSNPSR